MGILTTLVSDEDLAIVARRLGVQPRQNPLWLQMDGGVPAEGYHWRDLIVALARRVEELEARLDADCQ